MSNYFNSNGLLTPAQHAYQPGHFTGSALVHMTDRWLTFMDERKLVGAVLLSFTAAYDVTDHFTLLKCYSFSPSALTWVKSYLSDRTQQVFFNGSFSNCIRTSCSVPQGSCLGPPLFPIFINDLPYVVKNADVVLYADDSTLFCASPISVEFQGICIC